MVYKNCYLMWDAKCLRDITPEFLAPLLLLAPQLGKPSSTALTD